MTPHRVHRKSGLVRQLSIRDVFLINTFGYALGIALTINPAFIGGFAPSANIYIVLSCGLLAALFNGFTYGLFAAVMPKTGGDYVYVTRSLGHTWGPLLGFVASFGFTLAQLYGFALNSFWAFVQALAPGLATIGMVAHDDSLVHLSTRIGDEKTALLLALGLMGVIFCVSLLGLNVSRRLFIAAFFVAMMGPILQCYAFFSVDHATFITLFDSFVKSSNLSSLDYKSIVELGRQQGLASNAANTLSDSLRALPLGFLMFLGFTYSAYMGSEVKEASRSQLVGIFAALGIGAAFFYVAMGRYFQVVGSDFNAALSAKGVVLPAGNSLAFFAGVIVKSTALNILMNVGNMLWFILVPLVILQVCCRNIQVWAIDYLLPERVARTNRFGSPGAAAAVAVGFGIILLLFSYFRHSYTPVGAVALAAVSILLSGVSAVVYAGSRGASVGGSGSSALFSPTAFRFFGVGTVIIFAWVLYAAVMYPEISGGEEISKTHGVAAVFWLVVGVYSFAAAVFILRKRALEKQLAKEGLTVDDIWGSLPED